MGSKKVEIGIEVNKKGATKQVKQFSSDVAKSNKKIRSEFKKTQQASTGLGLNLKTLAGAAGGLFIFSKVNNIIKQSISLAGEQASAVAKVEQTIKATGGAAGVTSAELEKMAQGFQNVTTFGDEVILRGQSMLLTFKGIGKDVFPAATEAMLNLSTAMGTDVKESAIQLGKALNDPTTGLTALRRVGITFSKEQETIIKNFQKTGDIASAQKLILKELESQFGGLAKAVALSGEGPLIQFQNVVGDVQELLGDALIPLLLEATGGFKKFLIAGQESGKLKAVFDGIGNSVKFLFAIVGDTFSGLSAVFKIISAGLNSFVGLFFTAISKITGGVEKLIGILPDRFIPDGWKGGIADTTSALEALGRQGLISGNELFQEGVGSVSEGSRIVKHFKDIANGVTEAKKAVSGVSTGTVGGDVSGGSSVDPALQKRLQKEQAAAQKRADAKAAADAKFIESELKLFDDALLIKEEFRRQSLTSDEQDLLVFQDQLKQKNLVLREAGFKEIDIVGQVIKRRAEMEKAAADARLQTNITATQGILANTGAALAGFKKFAAAQKAIAITEAVISGTLGVQKALGSAPPPLNFLLAASVGAAAAANVAKISSQKFAQGGVVEGPRSGDSVPILANGGERVLTARQNREFERVLAGGGGGNTITFQAPVINVQNGDPVKISSMVQETMQEQIQSFSELQRDSEVHELV